METEHCEVVFPYVGLNKDELSLRVGQVVTIISKDVEDAGWWKGELDRMVGVFPENFVKLIEKDNNDKKPIRPPPPISMVQSYSDNIAQNDSDRSKKLNKSFSFEEKYGLDSLKKELKETSISRHKSNAEKKRHAPRPHSLLPTVNVMEVKEVETSEEKKASSSTEDIFDDISSKKLTNTTAGRVKAPKRRPPSQHFLKENIPEELRIEQEDLPEEEKKKDKINAEKPILKMLDVSQVKLRETKKPTKTMARSSSPIAGAKPSWLDELSKKQANRKSLGFEEELTIEKKISRSKSKDEEDIKKSNNKGLPSSTTTSSPLPLGFTAGVSLGSTAGVLLGSTAGVSSLGSTAGVSSLGSTAVVSSMGSTAGVSSLGYTTGISSQSVVSLGWDRRILDKDRNSNEDISEKEDSSDKKTVTEIMVLKDMLSQMKSDMQNQLSELKSEIDKEKDARVKLELEVKLLRKRCQLE